MTPIERARIDQLAASVAERWAIANWAFYRAHVLAGFSGDHAIYLTESNMTNLQALANDNQRPTEE